MKMTITGLLKGRSIAFRLSQSAVALLLLPLSAMGADTAYTSTGWVKDVPVLPILCTNTAGQVLLRGNAQVLDVQSTDPRLTGRRLVFANGSYLPDGTAQIWGSAYQQVGTFDEQTNFTATAGLWEINYTGVMQADFSLNLSLAGYGSGGVIDGQRIEETMTRDMASGPVDPAVPYLYTGTLKDAPVNTLEVVDNFDDNIFAGSIWGHGTCAETNKQFCVLGSLFTTQTKSIYDSYVFAGYPKVRTVSEGITAEWRVDLVHLDDNGTNTAILALGTGYGPGYAFHVSRDFAFLAKWTQTGISILFCDKKPLPTTNVVMALALTRMGQDLAITTRLLDKVDPNKVLYEHSPVMDTRASDATLDSSQFQALTGISLLDLVPDRMQLPPQDFYSLLGTFQYTDGHQPVPTAVFDNYELRTYEVPHVSLSSAVQLTWPAPSGAYSVEWASRPEGPWQPLQQLSVPGRQEVNVPTSAAAQFFRVRQAP